MQKLKIINCLGEIIELGVSSPFLLSHIEGLGIPTITPFETQAVGLDGSDVHDILLEDRLLTVKMTLIAKDRKEMYEKRRKIMRVLNPKLFNPKNKKRGELTLYYTNDFKTYRIYAYVDSTPDFKERINNFNMADISFNCFEPYWLDEKDTIKKIKYFDGGLKFPLTFNTKFAEAGYSKIVENTGDVEVPCILEYIGAAQNPVITNETTGEFIKVNKTLEEGQKLVINTEEGKETVDIILADGSSLNVFNWLDIESTFFKLVQGENKITYSSENDLNTNVIVNVTYSNRYVGV